MATIKTRVSISSADLTSSTLNLSNSFNVTGTATTGLARQPITSTAVGTASGQITIYVADDYAATAYIYLKNMDTTITDYIYIFIDTSTVILRLSGGEAVLLPTNADKTYKCYATTSGTVLEYMVFGTDQ
tara:strand:+ start:329 stop:718 length:390 start_codon:yes stop_codon:yes gene_type:complete